MLSQRFTNEAMRLAALAVLFALTACASGPAGVPAQDAPQDRRADKSPVVSADGETLAPIIPPEVTTLFEQATAVMAAGDFVDAELRFKEFVLLYPDYPGAFVNLAIIHVASDDAAAAQGAIDSALALDPNHPAALNQLGMLLRRNGNFLQAEAAYLKAVTVSPDYALAHYNLGVLNELYLQRLDTALQHFEAYQALVGEDKQVAKWISDLRRRTAANQRTANVAD